jgi:hypothetical protein
MLVSKNSAKNSVLIPKTILDFIVRLLNWLGAGTLRARCCGFRSFCKE